MNIKKIIAACTSLVIIGAASSFDSYVSIRSLSASESSFAAEANGINVSYRSVDEIREYVAKHPFDLSASPSYAVSPQTSSPYAAGSLSQNTLNKSLNSLNVVRFIAGLDEVSLSSDYCSYTQAASLVNAVNNSLSHSPAQPSNMSNDLYQLGLTGAGRSNIGMGYINPANSVINGYMHDKDSSNITTMGHRRWCLNPNMKSTGFGQVGRYTAMYAFDSGNSSGAYGVCWPAQNMPVEYFGSSVPWSISMGYNADISSVKVTITRTSDSKKWSFSESSSDGDFYVNNSGYGQKGCIIFRPSGINGYSDGDIFNVKIEGLKETVSYTVSFFSVRSLGLGDVDGDGAINAIDASLVLTEYGQLSTNRPTTLTPKQNQDADVNKDGNVNAIDASLILAYYAYVSTDGQGSFKDFLDKQ